MRESGKGKVKEEEENEDSCADIAHFSSGFEVGTEKWGGKEKEGKKKDSTFEVEVVQRFPHKFFNFYFWVGPNEPTISTFNSPPFLFPPQKMESQLNHP